jgi:hypothetical protein
MTPSPGEGKQVTLWAHGRTDLWRAGGPQEGTDCLGQIIKIEIGGAEDPRHRRRVRLRAGLHIAVGGWLWRVHQW